MHVLAERANEMDNSLLSQLRREREARDGTPPASFSASSPASQDDKESPAAKKQKAAKPEVIDLLDSDDDVPAISSDEQR